ncbi:hypothetical protein Raf01_19230 [Rugosimonospora africana]|uniref:LysM domain-containing protein n=1 Tax=Rugosimonospora africana TaxID=556532 RepID=A0A8J3VPT4_9ACTN|nr:hypothetical protein Raf01_19230 [Rugosimonospora africana]
MVVLTLLLLLAGVGAMLAAPAGDASPPPGAAPTVVVRPGDTLWSIAARFEPGPDPIGAVERIRRLNRLPGYRIEVGQTLTLPAHRQGAAHR